LKLLRNPITLTQEQMQVLVEYQHSTGLSFSCRVGSRRRGQENYWHSVDGRYERGEEGETRVVALHSPRRARLLWDAVVRSQTVNGRVKKAGRCVSALKEIKQRGV
jgi:hypothetical protein